MVLPRLLRPDSIGLRSLAWVPHRKLQGVVVVREEWYWQTPVFGQLLRRLQGTDYLRTVLVISRGPLVDGYDLWGCGPREGRGRRYFWLLSAHVGSPSCLDKAGPTESHNIQKGLLNHQKRNQLCWGEFLGGRFRTIRQKRKRKREAPRARIGIGDPQTIDVIELYSLWV